MIKPAEKTEPLHEVSFPSWRRFAIGFSTMIGAIVFLGSILFLVAGAGMYGSPVSGDAWFNTTLLLIVVLGPMALLPCSLIETKWPAWGGIALCNLAIPVTVFLILNNIRQWGFAIYDAAIGTLCISIPLFLIGTILWKSGFRDDKWAKFVWWPQVLILVGFLVYFAGAIVANELHFFEADDLNQLPVD